MDILVHLSPKKKKEIKLGSMIMILVILIVLILKTTAVTGGRDFIYIDPDFYKIIIGKSIPTVNEASDRKPEDLDLVGTLVKSTTEIDLNHKFTILGQIIPFFKYANRELYAEHAVFNELGLYWVGGKSAYENNEDYFDGIHQDEIFDIFFEEHDGIKVNYSLDQLKDFDFMLKHFYNYDPQKMRVNESHIDCKTFFQKDLTADIKSNKPKVLIFHTHSQERYVGGKEGVLEVGDYLAKILEKKYGIQTIHDKGIYDKPRTGAYEKMDEPIKKILRENPSIEVTIDIHRDGIGTKQKLLTTVNGKPTAKIMFVNGLCEILEDDKMVPIDSLPNPYVEENMAFAFRMQLKAEELYPGLMRKIYLKPYRYSTHMRAKSLLVEVGAQYNEIQEGKNAMEPLAELLYLMLTGKG